ncbi:MAG: hypothetical protein RLP44_27880 [Aggregatilineales bacterium]
MLSNTSLVQASNVYIVSFTNTTSHGNEFITSAGDTDPFVFDKWDQTVSKDATHPDDIATGMVAVVLSSEAKNDPLLFLVSLSTDSNPKRILPIALKYDHQLSFPVLGVVILIDISYWTFTIPRVLIRRDGTREEVTEGYYFVNSAKEEIQSLIDLIPNTPYIIAGVTYENNKIMPLDEVRDILDIGETVKIIPCDTKSKEITTNVLLELLKSQAQTAHIKHAIKIIERQSSE